ncbi:glycosyltransferase [Nocardia sp. NBC_00565]|uniref:glycosyltransferase family 2 protein n=1 Tax=Nocardia sp. NBC_00565 TaxID=2975993 RepID=UPI002E81EC77|nr:glycosyltransferase family 2 protein [Nocardia sp. NBC_00565]WUC04379.1 glycosyltransferase [Nocardia sp. NBC_00565]
MLNARVVRALNASAATATRIGAATALLGCGVALFNRATVRRLPVDPTTTIESVTVCIPARDEAQRLPGLIDDLRGQVGVPQLRVLILDDASSDGTEAAALAAIASDPRCTVVRSEAEPAPGWTGKTAACARLAELADAAVLIFLDADVRLAPTAIAAAVTELRHSEAALLSPWPYQVAESLAEALVQPLLCWSWAASLPIAVANRSRRRSTAVACGQFLVFDAAAYHAIGAHAAVAASPTEDLDIARALRRSDRRTALVAAGRSASTRMYRDAAELETGYTRWLWSAYGATTIGGAAVGAVAALAYCVPPLAAIGGRGSTRTAGLLGYSAAVASRLLARSLESTTLTRTDLLAALAHPISMAAYLRLYSHSRRARHTNTLTWKSRHLSPG